MMKNLIMREPTIADKDIFLNSMQSSKSLHYPWVKPPMTLEEFETYLHHSLEPNQKSYLIFNHSNNLVGVFNLNEIVRGSFQNAYLGFYGIAGFDGQGYMSAGLKLIIAYAFNNLELHRVEANVQPDNFKSKQLIKNNGFRYEGFSPHYLKINDEWRDHERWALTMEDFRNNNSKDSAYKTDSEG